MTPEQRLQVEDELLSSDSLEQEAEREEAMAEAERHLDIKVEARDTLREFFRRQRPDLYVAADIPVYYPGQKSIRPDLMAVTGVDTHRRDSWLVSAEGKGLDLALEIHHKGKWRKDFVENVERYAGLGIREYFAFDVNRRELRGWRLPPGAQVYQSLRGPWGRFNSEVLGLDLFVEEGELRFFLDNAELLGGNRLVHKLQLLTGAAVQRAEVEAQRAETACLGLAEAILTILRLRQIPLEAAQRQRIHETRDAQQLRRWLDHATTVTTVAELFAGGVGVAG